MNSSVGQRCSYVKTGLALRVLKTTRTSWRLRQRSRMSPEPGSTDRGAGSCPSTPSCRGATLLASGHWGRHGRPYTPRTLRAALFMCVGVLLCASSLVLFADPEHQDPVSASDWFAVVSFSAALFALALALPMLAQLIGGRDVFRVSLVPAVGAPVAGLSNLLEDALQMGFAFWFFIVGTAVTMVGLIAFTLVVTVVGRGRRRLLAAVPAATLIGVLLFENGGVLMLAAWLAVGAMVLGQPARPAAQAAPRSP